MTDMQAIEARSARRSYKGEMSAEQTRKLHELAATLQLQGGLTIRLVTDGTAYFNNISNSYGLFTGVKSFVVLAGRDKDEGLAEKAGYFGERLMLEVTKMGLGSCWVGGTFDRERVTATLGSAQQLVAVITVGPVKPEKNLIERTQSRAAKRRRKQPEEMCTIEGEAPEWFLPGVAAAAQAPSAMGHQPVHFYWKEGGATAAVPDMEGFHPVDLGIAKLHFEIGAGGGGFALGNGAAYSRTAQGGIF